MDARQGWQLAKRAWVAWSEDRAPSMGAALAYYALFSLAPLLVIAIGIAGLAFGEQAARGEVFRSLAALVGADAAQAVEALVASARKPATGVLATIGGIVALLLGASGAFRELQDALDRIWRVPGTARGGWRTLLRTRLVAFAAVLGVAAVLFASLVVSALLSGFGEGPLVRAADLAAGFVVTTTLFTLVYKLLPSVRLEWRDVWVGAAITAALFTAGKFVVGLYLGRASVASAFGAAGSLVVVMVWVYYSAQIFLLGAEFTRLYAAEHGSRRMAAGPSAGRVRVRAAANAPALRAPPRPAAMLAKLGAALALGVSAGIGLQMWRRR